MSRNHAPSAIGSDRPGDGAAGISLRPVRHWHTIWVPLSLALFALAVVAVALVVHRLDRLHPGAVHPALVRFFWLNNEANFPTWFSV